MVSKDCLDLDKDREDSPLGRDSVEGLVTRPQGFLAESVVLGLLLPQIGRAHV